MVADGPTDAVLGRYEQESNLDIASWALTSLGSDLEKCPIYFKELELLDEHGSPRTLFRHGDRIRLRLHYLAREPVENPNFNVSLIRSDNVACCNYNTAMDQCMTGLILGEGTIELLTPPIKLVSDLYTIHLLVWDSHFQRLYCAQVAKKFHVSHPVLNSDFGVFHEGAEWSQDPSSPFSHVSSREFVPSTRD